MCVGNIQWNITISGLWSTDAYHMIKKPDTLPTHTIKAYAQPYLHLFLVHAIPSNRRINLCAIDPKTKSVAVRSKEVRDGATWELKNYSVSFGCPRIPNF